MNIISFNFKYNKKKMESYVDYIDSFNLKPCKNGIHCVHLKKCRCRYKHYKTDNENMNILVEKSNLYAIQLSFEREKQYAINRNHNISLEINKYYTIQDLEIRNTQLNQKEQELDDKERSLSNKCDFIKIREEDARNKEIALLEKERGLEVYKNELENTKAYFLTKFNNQESIIDYKFKELDYTIKDYYSKIGKLDCEKFKHFDEEVLSEVMDENVCDICLTPISDCSGIDSVFNILECGHSFCMKCIHNLTKDKKQMSIKCPTCRKVSSVCTIKRNISLDKVVEHLKRLNVNT